MYPLDSQNKDSSQSQFDSYDQSDTQPTQPEQFEKTFQSSSQPSWNTPLYSNDPIFPEEPLPPPPPSSLRKRIFGAVREVVETVVPAVIIALLINLFLVQATRVYGQSMEPNLHSNQRLVVEKITYTFQMPERGDVVVLKVHEDAKDMLIKRVIALPDETVEIRNGQVIVNGNMLTENYIVQPTRGAYGLITVPENHIFVLGDNRGASNDSRSFGPINLDNVVGKAWLSYWPLEDVGFVH